MLSVEIISTGCLDRHDSAFPQAVQLPGGDILCSFSVFGGSPAIRLRDSTFLVTHWSKEGGPFGIRRTKLRVDW